MNKDEERNKKGKEKSDENESDYENDICRIQ